MEREQQRRIVEAVILASPEPIPAARIASLVPRCNPSQVRALVKELNGEYAEQRRAFEIWEVAGGYQLRSLPEFAPYLKQIQDVRPLRLSNAALETLAIVAYRQPVTRGEVEHVRGVDAGAVLRSLLERNLIRIAGHREVPGRPIEYGTTRRFLEVFGLAKLGDLPTLRDLADLVSADDAADESEDSAEAEGTADAFEVAAEAFEDAEEEGAIEADPAIDAAQEEGGAPDAHRVEEPRESAPAATLVTPPGPTH
ncbi:MAG TPA: SMC-Scp complex subunit ScpB [Myxococcota bacterium]